MGGGNKVLQVPKVPQYRSVPGYKSGRAVVGSAATRSLLALATCDSLAPHFPDPPGIRCQIWRHDFSSAKSSKACVHRPSTAF